MVIKSRYFILRTLSNISLYVYPPLLSSFFLRIKDSFLSYRFALQTNSVGWFSLHSPFYTKGHQYMRIGSNFVAGPGFRIECWDNYEGVSYQPSITIGENVCFNYNCHLGAIDKIVIGNNVLIGSHVLITDHSHGNPYMDEINIPPAKRTLYSKGPVIIEDNVWIGEGVAVLPNVTIGHNSIIGANTVITKSIPPYSVVGGNPCRIIRSLHNDLICD